MQNLIIPLLQNQNQTTNNGAIMISVSGEQNVKLGLLDRTDWSFPTTEATISVRRNIFLLPGTHQSLSLPLEVFPMFFIWNGIFTSELSGPPQNDHCVILDFAPPPCSPSIYLNKKYYNFHQFWSFCINWYKLLYKMVTHHFKCAQFLESLSLKT